MLLLTIPDPLEGTLEDKYFVLNKNMTTTKDLFSIEDTRNIFVVPIGHAQNSWPIGSKKPTILCIFY